MTEQAHLGWFASSAPLDRFKERPIAYFCAEFALDARVRGYAGGLGVLAGDVVREAADRALPFVGVGLYYRKGYACAVHPSGTACECEAVTPEQAGLEPVLQQDGTPMVVRIPMQDRSLALRAWRWKMKGVSVYLLDADMDANDPSDRAISGRLYVSDKELRLKQEIALGIGGLRLLEALGIHPSVYHLNEGHSAFLAFDMIRHQMLERGLSFDEAKQFARRRIVLTNHTLVHAGQEIFSNDLVALMLDGYAKELRVPVSDLVRLGLVQESSQFSMTMLALRMCSVINAVSKLHARKAREIWADHPMAAITNGIHVPTWDAVGASEAEGGLWRAHQDRKKALLAVIRERTGRAWGEDELLLGWARRFADYKRPLAAIDDPERLAAIARAAGRPVRIAFAGRAHPDDAEGNAMMAELRKRVDGDLRDVACFLPGYDLELAETMIAGCDVWLNTPVVGFEACGTSGMKAALNGVLPFSTKDGWVEEVETYGIGWIIDNLHVTQSILEVLERDIAPMYYARGANGVPEDWLRHMRNARAMTKDRFSATRMLRGYVEMLYS